MVWAFGPNRWFYPVDRLKLWGILENMVYPVLAAASQFGTGRFAPCFKTQVWRASPGTATDRCTSLVTRVVSHKLCAQIVQICEKCAKMRVFGGPGKQAKTRVRVYRCAGGSKMTFFRSK